MTSTVRIGQDVVFRVLDGEAVILNLASATYYGLDSVGTRIWDLIQERGRTDAVLAAMLNEYEVDPERCEQDLLHLLGELHKKGLIEMIDGNAEEAP